MMLRRSIYRVALLALLVGLAIGCQRPGRPAEERPAPETDSYSDGRGYDPLELPRDREIVPEKYPSTGSIKGGSALTETPSDSVDSGHQEIDSLPVELDTLNNQVFRVQLFTSKKYGEARQAVVVAEEIFDQPVYLDYEVPYYKVRVGNFASRRDAEGYQPKASAAGYANPWVVVVNIGVKEAAPAYDTAPEGGLQDTLQDAGGDEPDDASGG